MCWGSVQPSMLRWHAPPAGDGGLHDLLQGHHHLILPPTQCAGRRHIEICPEGIAKLPKMGAVQ